MKFYDSTTSPQPILKNCSNKRKTEHDNSNPSKKSPDYPEQMKTKSKLSDNRNSQQPKKTIKRGGKSRVQSPKLKIKFLSKYPHRRNWERMSSSSSNTK